ncbi:small, acid-soluble spore protein, alpha/beta type [Cohnella yongneupensis]|uniref:Small, acid-soluble spore protein, alpha/beta type n=1 Tax=Cohnella yongneupensis TaxID=425006 RepID=A0ABW0QY79_9BACL
MAKRRQHVVPGCENALNQMKYEIASEIGVPLNQGSAGMDTEFAGELGSIGGASVGQQYYGNLTSRETGSIGGEITKRLIRQAQNTVI